MLRQEILTTQKKWAKKAVEIGRDDIQEHLEKELKFYEDGKPWRENKAKEREGKPMVDRSKLKTIQNDGYTGSL